MSSRFSSPYVISRRSLTGGLLAVALVRPVRAADRESLQEVILAIPSRPPSRSRAR
jgi:hypothetical protein